MIKSSDIHDEIKNCEEILEKIKGGKINEVDFKWALLKSQLLTVKLLHNIRSNQVEIMRKEGITLRQPLKRENESTISK